MSAAELKYTIFQLIDSINDEGQLKAIFELLNKSDRDWWVALGPAEKQAIEEGLSDVRSGNVVTHKEAIDQLAERFPFIKSAG